MSFSFDGEDPPHATPLDDDVEGLVPMFVTTRDELNQMEQANIESATHWAEGEVRRTYIDALRSADEGDIGPLHHFATA